MVFCMVLCSGDFPKHAEISRASTTVIIKYVYGFSAWAHRLPSAWKHQRDLRESVKYTLFLV